MWITIIADASFCPDTKVGGYAFWIASQRGKEGGDGTFAGNVVNHIAAEMQALLNGLHAAVKRGLVRGGDCVLLQTDCQAAIDAFEGKRLNITQEEQGLVSWLERFKEVNDLHIRTKHVKGHTRREDSRYVVNNICDRKARANMRLARGQHYIQEIKESLNG